MIESDSIIDEVQSAQLSKSDPIKDDDSILDDAAPAIDDSQIESDIMEDSIIRDEYTSDNYHKS